MKANFVPLIREGRGERNNNLNNDAQWNNSFPLNSVIQKILLFNKFLNVLIFSFFFYSHKRRNFDERTDFLIRTSGKKIRFKVSCALKD